MARLFRGYPLIGIHRGLSRLAVFPTHFLIMLVDFFLYLQRWTTFYNVHAHDATKEGLSEWFSRRNEKQRGPLHKKNDILLQTLGQDGRGWRRRDKKSFMCLIPPPVSVRNWSKKLVRPFCAASRSGLSRTSNARWWGFTWSPRRTMPGAQTLHTNIKTKNKKINNPSNTFQPHIVLPSSL